MKILFVHEGFPAQPRELLRVLGANPENDVRFLHRSRGKEEIPGVKKVLYQRKPGGNLEPGDPLQLPQHQLFCGVGAAEACIKLKKENFIPDVIYGHSGWGATLFLKDVFESSPVGINLEWYYNFRDAKYRYRYERDGGDFLRWSHSKMMNNIWLQDFAMADRCVAATNFQKAQFPKVLQSGIDVIHEGVNTSFFKPDSSAKLILPRVGLDLSGAREIITYVSRGFEEIRGFPQFMESIYHLQKMRPKAHVVLVGLDRIFYGGWNTLPDGHTWKSLMLKQFKFDESRLHFVGCLDLEEYRTVLQCSKVHVYLSWPFVTSWSLLEAMACGALVVGSNTGCVEEVLKNGENGYTVDMFETEGMATKLAEILSKPKNYYKPLCNKAREKVLENYDLADCMKRKLVWLSELTTKKSA